MSNTRVADLMRDGSILQFDFDQITTSSFTTLADSFRHFLGLAKSHADLAILISNNDECAEGEATATLHHFGATINMHHSFFKFRYLGFAFQRLPLIRIPDQLHGHRRQMPGRDHDICIHRGQIPRSGRPLLWQPQQPKNPTFCPAQSS